MSRSRLLRRFVAAVAVGAVALLGPHTLMSTGAAPDSCATKRHGCGIPSLSACCCAAPVLPEGSLPPLTTAAPITPLQNAAPATMSETPAQPALELRLATAPPHGYCTVDLPTLLSTFLI